MPQSNAPAAASGVRTVTANFVAEKETKNTVKFTEQPDPGQPPAIQTLYVQKWLVGSAKSVRVTLEIPS